MLSKRVLDSGRGRSVEFERVTLLQEDGLIPGNDETAAEPGGKDLSEIEREAYQKAFEAGQQSGLQMAEKKIEVIVKRFSRSLENLAVLREEIIKQTERDLVELSIEIAKKLVHREIRIDEKIIATLVRVALDRLAVKSAITVRVNSQDYEVLENELKEILGEDGYVELKIDESLKRGDCLVESDYGSIDARISEQFKEIEEGLLASF
jgi:flagellar assembly protein FliH